MNRISVVGVLAALASVIQAQDLSAKISVDIPATRASVAFAELSKIAKVTLEPAGNLQNEVFVVSAHDITVDELMKRIAQAESGRWQQEKNGAYLLVRDNATSVAQERAELKERTDAIRDAVTKLTKEFRSQGNFDQASAQKLADETHQMLDHFMESGSKPAPDMTGIEQKTPTARAIARILASIDPAKLAQIGVNQRVVFSTQPTQVQAPLGGQGYSAFQSFITEQQTYTEAYNSGQAQDPNTRRMIFFNGVGNPSMGSGDPKLGLGVGLVIVQRRSDFGLDVQIVATDPKLEVITSGNYMLRLPQQSETQTKSAKEDPLQISDEAKEMAKALGKGEGGSGSPRATRVYSVASSGGGLAFTTVGGDGEGQIKLSPGLRAKVLNPDKYDPLSFVPSEALTALAHGKAENLVALLPDSCFGGMTQLFAGNVTPSQLMANLGSYSLSATQDGDWMVVSPLHPASARAETIDRPALKTLLQSMDRNDCVRLDDAANFALAETKVPGLRDFDILYPRMINNGATEHDLLPLALGSFGTYKFYGSLSPGQRQSVMSGQPYSFSNLTPQQVSLIADMLYNSPMPPEVQNPEQQNRRGAQETKVMSIALASQSGAFGGPMFFGGPMAQTERTIVVPNGVPSDGYLRGSVSSQPITQGINSQTGASSFMDAGSLAFSRNANNRSDLADFATPQYDKYKMAHQSTLSIRFFFNPRVSLSRSLSDVSVDANTAAVPYDSLPADFRNQVDQIAQSLQRSFQKLPGRGQGTPPPQ
ncbi:MAG TPA: hypothetical protein VHE55_12565 [Fimbriimonadaceae bacterium]|nr:hypothetical protein [Fimbriimonadaceae bacterium]